MNIQCVAMAVYLDSKEQCHEEFDSYGSLMEHVYREHKAVLVGLVIASGELYQVVGSEND